MTKLSLTIKFIIDNLKSTWSVWEKQASSRSVYDYIRTKTLIIFRLTLMFSLMAAQRIRLDTDIVKKLIVVIQMEHTYSKDSACHNFNIFGKK